MSDKSLENLIRNYVVLGKKSSKDFEILKCPMCNDYKERGGFKFDSGDVIYSCFNCSYKAIYSEVKNKHSISKKLKDLLVAFGIPENEIDKTISFNFFKDKNEIVKDKVVCNLEFPSKEIKLPTGFVLVSSNKSIWCEIAELYLQSRSLKSSDFNYYVTEETSYIGRLLIPYYFRGKIIYFQGRSLDTSIKPRYKNPTIEKNNIFFNMDELYRHTDEPLFVTEGPLDSLSIGRNAVSILGSALSEFKRVELQKVSKNRKVIFVIDKNLNGKKLGLEILNYENPLWYVVIFPDNVEDSNDALLKFGKLWLITHLTTSCVNGFHGKLLLELNCSGN